MLVPTNTTSTAAYVAVATNVSELVALIPRDMIDAKMTKATDAVIRLFVLFAVGRLIISMGTTRLDPPMNAKMKRASLSTKGEMLSGGCFCRYSSVRWSISDLV